jgi:diaminohydroxyphosphoribosylaminopyrimidine deaminase/5-amino-6-(5-phosphoribosylamino)uracil reductase
VVLDSTARTPPSAQLIQAATPSRALIVVGADAPEARVRALAATGAEVVRCPDPTGRVSPRALLSELFARDVRGVLVEGGAEVAASFVDGDLVDRVAIFFAPLVIGGRGAPTVVGGVGRELKRGLALESLEVRRVGDDLFVEADVRRA